MIVEKESSLVKHESKVSEHTENSSSEAPVVAQPQPVTPNIPHYDESLNSPEVEIWDYLEPAIQQTQECPGT